MLTGWQDMTTMWLEDTLTYFNMKILMWRCPEGQCSALAPARGRTLGRPSLGRDHPWKCWDVLRQNYLQLPALEKTLMDDLTRGLARPKPQVQATKKIYAECDANLLVHAVIVEPTSVRQYHFSWFLKIPKQNENAVWTTAGCILIWLDPKERQKT